MATKGGELVIIGGGGHALVVYEAARAAGFSVVGFFDDDDSAGLGSYVGRLGEMADLTPELTLPGPLILGIGGLSARRHQIDRLGMLPWATVVHPSAIVSESATIGAGVFIGAGTIVNGRAKVGEHAILNTGSIIEHDCELAQNVHMAPRSVIGGGACVGEDSLIGIGATVLPLVRVGNRCVVSGGGAAAHDIPDQTTAIGVPARAAGRGGK